MRIVLLCAFLLNAFLASAHEVRPARLSITQVTDSTYQIYWKLPAIKEGVLRLQPIFDFDYEVVSNDQQQDLGDAYVTIWTILPMSEIQGSQIIIEGLEKTITDVFVTINLINGDAESFLVRPSQPFFKFSTNRTWWQIAKDYIILGIEHILLGYDHLLFVLCLLWIIRGIKKLIQTITAFTLAHSITLAASVLGWVHLPGPPVEAIIALSIVFLAVEIINAQSGEKVFSAKYPWIVALTFGLLHGFGFAGALTEVGLPQSAIPLSLFGFNLGVEIGQILFVFVILALVKIFEKGIKKLPELAPKLAAYGIGSIASFWLIERVIGFWP